MFREGTCPKCKEKIQVPDDHEKVRCMFCGEEIEVAEALGEKKEIQQQDVQNLPMYESIIQTRMAELFAACDNPMKQFKKNSFDDDFTSFCNANRDIFEAMEMVYVGGGQSEEAALKLTDHVLEAARGEIAKETKKSARSQKQMDFNFLVSIQFIPAVRKYPASFTEPFSEKMVERWNETFGANIGLASYDIIAGGFRKKLCYITTAVCVGLGKGPDCPELQILKDYRDQYLETTPEGHALVEEYYDIAPTIVKRMEKSPDSVMLYKELYQDYLTPCIQEIAAGQYEECRAHYQEMVLDLKEKYMQGGSYE
ncbi:MAG: hypothetical protein LUE24_12740 [Lachnospiraceae bacterium]|nr:hypothetical protein [Lachnospiraceae bacterium]